MALLTHRRIACKQLDTLIPEYLQYVCGYLDTFQLTTTPL